MEPGSWLWQLVSMGRSWYSINCYMPSSLVRLRTGWNNRNFQYMRNKTLTPYFSFVKFQGCHINLSWWSGGRTREPSLSCKIKLQSFSASHLYLDTATMDKGGCWKVRGNTKVTNTHLTRTQTMKTVYDHISSYKGILNKLQISLWMSMPPN